MITATEITQTGQLFLQIHVHMFKSIDRSIDLCVLWDACHELLCIFSDFNASDTQDAEVTEALTLYAKCLP